MIRETIVAKGHPNITAKHTTTFQVTKDKEISKRADCVIGIGADRAMHDFSESMKTALRNDGAPVCVTIRVGEMQEIAMGYGSPNLTCSNSQDIVARKSDFTSGRTLMIKADKAAADLDRRLIERLKKLEDIIITVDVDS
ncbi:MAG: DUF371 domain-containing protein [Halobacteriota archaeon]